MLLPRIALRFLVAAVAPILAAGFSVMGYVHENSYEAVDWASAVTSTTHLVLFSLAPSTDGGLQGLGRLREVLKRLRQAFQSGGHTKVLVAIGGPGRSQPFKQLSESQKSRRRLAKELGKLLQEEPILSGVELCWDAPDSAQQWRNMGRLAADVREAFPQDRSGLLLTMSYHPRSGALENFAALRGKKSDRSFVDLFDLFHAMVGIDYGERVSKGVSNLDTLAISEWINAGLAPDRLCLGLPLFGMSKTTQRPMGYKEILSKEPDLANRPDTDWTKDGLHFTNGYSVAAKVRYARTKGLGGIALFELGQDLPVSRKEQGSLLWYALTSAEGPLQLSWWEYLDVLAEKSPVSEDQTIAGLAALQGGFLLMLVLFRNPSDKRTSLRPRIPFGEEVPADNGAPEASATIDAADAEGEGSADDKTAGAPAEEKEALRQRAPHATDGEAE